MAFANLARLRDSAGTLCDEDGKLFIKPCTQNEISFYQTVQREAANPHISKDKFRDLSDIIPVFMGTLMLTDPADERIGEAVTGIISDTGDIKTDKTEISAAVTEQIAKVAAPAEAPAPEEEWIPTNGGKIKTDTAIVLENSTCGFKKPNILDLKLGVRLHADDAPAKKKQKMEKLSAETTHSTHGFRVAGMKTYRGSDDASQLDENGFMVYDKDYGRTAVTHENLTAAIGKFVFNKAAGIDEELGTAVCKALATEVARIESVLSQHELTMYSASLLIVLEGDGEALREAIRRNNEEVDAWEKDPNQAAKRVDSGIVLDEDGEFVDEDAADGMFWVKLIDFAHVHWTPGQGSDPNLLKGVRSIKDIFEELGGEEFAPQ